MRAIVSISLPNDTVQYMKQEVKKRKLPSLSEYVRFLVGMERNMITEDDVLQYEAEALKAHKEGKTKILRSMEDLM